eukprot:2152380-Pyramimonas_sp.AAC.1
MQAVAQGVQLCRQGPIRLSAGGVGARRAGGRGESEEEDDDDDDWTRADGVPSSSPSLIPSPLSASSS